MFNHCTLEALLMCWRKRDIWKAGIAIAGILLLLVFTMWIPVSSAGAHAGASGLAAPVTITVQVTPTEDATVTALNKEKLTQDVSQQQHTWENWFWSSAAPILSSFFSILIIVTGALIGFRQWRGNQYAEREKRAEELFQKVVEGLGGGKEEAKVGAAIVLRTFLGPDYKQFNRQAFDLAVAHLRLPRTSDSPEELAPLRQALISIFTEALPGTRDEWKKEQKKTLAQWPRPMSTSPALSNTLRWTWPLHRRKKELFNPRNLNATRIQLDNAYLWRTDLQQIWLGWASMREINLCQARLGGTWLWKADLSEADLSEADLRRADLGQANLSQARLSEADLRGATLWGANLRRADLYRADLREATSKEAPFLQADARRGEETTTLRLADLREANLREAKLHGATFLLADLREADLSGADLSGADLSGADLRGAKLDKVTLCNAKLRGVRLSGANFAQSELTKNDLREVKLTEVNIRGTDLKEADRSTLPWDSLRYWAHYIEADDSGVDLRGAELLLPDLSHTNLENARSLKDTDLRGVKGLTKEQLEACRAKGAIIDENATTSPPQSPVSPPVPSQSNEAQAPSAPPTQVSAPTPGTDGSSTTSSKPGSES